MWRRLQRFIFWFYYVLILMPFYFVVWEIINKILSTSWTSSFTSSSISCTVESVSSSSWSVELNWHTYDVEIEGYTDKMINWYQATNYFWLCIVGWPQPASPAQAEENNNLSGHWAWSYIVMWGVNIGVLGYAQFI